MNLFYKVCGILICDTRPKIEAKLERYASGDSGREGEQNGKIAC